MEVSGVLSLRDKSGGASVKIQKSKNIKKTPNKTTV
jgi:hypothetical protein